MYKYTFPGRSFSITVLEKAHFLLTLKLNMPVILSSSAIWSSHLSACSQGCVTWVFSLWGVLASQDCEIIVRWRSSRSFCVAFFPPLVLTNFSCLTNDSHHMYHCTSFKCVPEMHFCTSVIHWTHWLLALTKA